MTIFFYFLLIISLAIHLLTVSQSQQVFKIPFSIKQNSKIHFLLVLLIIFIIGNFVYLFISRSHIITLPDILPAFLLFMVSIFFYVGQTMLLGIADSIQNISTLKTENITDPLMGIYNRRYLDKRLEEFLEENIRYSMPLSLLMIDIDHFKNVNDTYGHQAGDEVLKALADLILKTVRTPDIVARYGGEEIVVMAPHTSLISAANLGERLRKKIENSLRVPYVHKKKKIEIKITISIGVAKCDDNNSDSKRLIMSADKALYKAKQKGRNKVIIYES